MKSEISLVPNAMACCALLAIRLLSQDGTHGGLFAFLLAIAAAAAGLLIALGRSLDGDEVQFVAVPITGMMLVAILSSFIQPGVLVRTILAMFLIGLAIGAPIMLGVAPSNNRPAVILIGTIAGTVGFGLAGAAYNANLPGSHLFVPLDQLGHLDLFKLNIFQGPSSGQIQDAINHNAAVLPSRPWWTTPVFLLQTTVVCAWDAAILGLYALVPCWIFGFPTRAIVNRMA